MIRFILTCLVWHFVYLQAIGQRDSVRKLTYLVDSTYRITTTATIQGGNIFLQGGFCQTCDNRYKKRNRVFKNKTYRKYMNEKSKKLYQENRIWKKRKYKEIATDYWLRSNSAMSQSIERNYLNRKVALANDSLISIKIERSNLTKELAIYSLGGMREPDFTLFYLKNNKDDSTFSRLRYIGSYNHLFSIIKVYTLNQNSNYQVFVYAVTAIKMNEALFSPDTCPYLHIEFCPQFGILSYHYPQNAVRIELEQIDNLSLSYYIKNNLCITPFCEIR